MRSLRRRRGVPLPLLLLLRLCDLCDHIAGDEVHKATLVLFLLRLAIMEWEAEPV